MIIASDVWDAIVAAVAAIGAVVSAVLANAARRHAAATSDATNHQHDQPDGTPRLYDAVLEMRAFMQDFHRRWGSLPPDIDTGERLAARLAALDDRAEANAVLLRDMARRLEHHVQREGGGD